MNDEIKETNYMLSYIATKIDDTLVDDYIGKINDYITNLQQENQDLSRMCELYGKSLYNAELTDYKSRIEKAVEYLDRHKIELSHSFDEPDCDYWIATNPQDIIDILNGRSDE